MNNAEVKAFLSRIAGEHREMKRQLDEVKTEYVAFRKAVENQPKSITEQINSIPGRRLLYNLSGTQIFTVALNDGLRGQPINFPVSQDGPFIMTHFPFVLWRPSLPTNATNFGIWRPPYTWPLPDQVIDGDRIDLSWELVSGGSQRNAQNLPAGPIFSRPDVIHPLPVPTMFNPNEQIQFVPTYNDISFDPGGTPTTQGTLQVTLIGYRIANM